MKNVEKIIPTLAKENGFALMDVLVSIGVILLILGSSISFMSHMNKSRAASQTNVEESSDLNQVLTYLSNPQYVGRLTQYKENEVLKSCLIADGKTCKADKKHELVVYDLFNNKILNISNSSGYKGMDFSFRGTCDDFASTCDIFSYINIDITFQKKKKMVLLKKRTKQFL